MKQQLHEDPLTYLPRRLVQEFAKGKNIYDSGAPNNYLYLVLSGFVKISSLSETDQHTATRIVGVEGFFGESCLVNSSSKESATALSRTSVMGWSRNEVENRMESYRNLASYSSSMWSESALHCKIGSQTWRLLRREPV